MEIAFAILGIVVAIIIGVWQIWLAHKQNKIAKTSSSVTFEPPSTSNYEDKVVDYLNKSNGAELLFAKVTKDEDRIIALQMNQGRKLIVDKPAYWKDVHAGEIESLPSYIHIETTHSRDVKPEGRGRHSREVPNRAVHTIEFLLSNSGNKTLVLKKVKLNILFCEPNNDYHVLGMTIEAGPVHTFVIEGVELSPDKSELVLHDKLIQIEPNGVVAYEVSLKSDQHYTYRVKFAFDWIDVSSGKEKTSFSEVFVLDFPTYSLHFSPIEMEHIANIEITPLVVKGKLNPFVAKILLNPKHNYYDKVIEVLLYDSARPAQNFIQYLKTIAGDKNASPLMKEYAMVSLLLLEDGVSGDLRSRETDKSVAQKMIREKSK